MFKDYYTHPTRFDQVMNDMFGFLDRNSPRLDYVSDSDNSGYNISYDTLFNSLYYNIKYNKDDNQYELEQDLPGVKEKDIELSVADDNKIKITATRYRGDKKMYNRTFTHTVNRDADLSKAVAKLEDGVLYVTIPVKKNYTKTIPFVGGG